jgi:hypothetical protein
MTAENTQNCGSFDLTEVYRRLQAKIESAGGQNILAERWGVSKSYLNDMVHARRDPNEKVLHHLGLRKVLRFVPVRGGA